ncbi:MAG: hypothetical protein U0414_30790 [Polyangiaceae bacterium]
MVAAFAGLFSAIVLHGSGCDSGAGIVCGDEVCASCCNAGECRATDTSCLEGSDEGGRLILRCDGPEDCLVGETCCAGIPGGSFAVLAECGAIAACAALPTPLYLCHDDGDCRPGERCSAAPFGLALTTCQ